MGALLYLYQNMWIRQNDQIESVHKLLCLPKTVELWWFVSRNNCLQYEAMHWYEQLWNVIKNVSYSLLILKCITFCDLNIWSLWYKIGGSDITVTANNGNWYEVYLNHLLDWNDAQNVCRRMGGFLAVIEDAREKKHIAEEIMEFLNKKKYGPKWKAVWIGLKQGNQ